MDEDGIRQGLARCARDCAEAMERHKAFGKVEKVRRTILAANAKLQESIAAASAIPGRRAIAGESCEELARQIAAFEKRYPGGGESSFSIIERLDGLNGLLTAYLRDLRAANGGERATARAVKQALATNQKNLREAERAMSGRSRWQDIAARILGRFGADRRPGKRP